jgi:hypothetical protein
VAPWDLHTIPDGSPGEWQSVTGSGGVSGRHLFQWKFCLPSLQAMQFLGFWLFNILMHRKYF